MQIGLFTPVFGKLGFDELLRELKRYPQITMLEIGTGGWPGGGHLDVDALLGSEQKRAEYLNKLNDAGLGISALACHANPVHPVEATAAVANELFEKTVRLAELLQVKTVVTFSGCPGGEPEDKTPNWITAAWPPEYVDALAWQWESVLVPYWERAAKFAVDAGVRVALEAHPGFCVYNTETMLKLREAVGPAIGLNLDPSHLWWQGMDVVRVIAAAGEAIYHVHAKDVAINSGGVAVNGVFDTKSYAQMRERSWNFRSVGWGHSLKEWKDVVSALRLAGYDGVLSIEHEDALLSVHEGLSSAVKTLEQVVLREPAVEAWWA